MAEDATIRKIGNSQGVILSKEVLAMLGAKEGDVLTFAPTPNGVTVAVSDAETERLRALADGIMERRRSVLKVLSQ